MELLNDAMIFAIAAHGDALRKGDGSPAILHAMEAAAVAATLTGDAEVLAAAVLHDTVEDAGADLEELRAQFGPRVAALVGAETEDKMRHLPPAASWRARKEAAIQRLRRAEDPGVAVVTLGDKLSNLRSFYRNKERQGSAIGRILTRPTRRNTTGITGPSPTCSRPWRHRWPGRSTTG